jgi:hypothetical protein
MPTFPKAPEVPKQSEPGERRPRVVTAR